jgi:adenine deaminase
MEKETIEKMKNQIQQARGLVSADCVLKNCIIVDVFCAELQTADIAICGEIIVGVGEYSGRNEIDCKGAYVCPGFMEGHIHIESSMLSPKQFTKTVAPHGTTTVICDPHEIANVAGIPGVKYILEESKGSECSVFVMAPSCVPATNLENSGAKLTSTNLEEILDLEQVLGVAEMMNFPGVLSQNEEVMKKLALGKRKKVPVDGHAPGLIGKDLQAYIGTGIQSDHECSTVAEAKEKLSSGMYLFIREGSTAKNLEELYPVITVQNSHRCLLVTDDCHPEELLNEGHMDRILRKVIQLGLDPVTAIQMVTINVADCFGLNDRGAIAPGRIADLVIFEDLEDIRPKTIFRRGETLNDNKVTARISKDELAHKYPGIFDSVHVNLEKLSFDIPAVGKIARVIQVKKNQLITESIELPVRILDGFAISDPQQDILKLAVVERHNATGNIGLGFVTGFGLKKGAIASTVGHDSHNITVVGCNDRDMALVIETLIKQGGGLAIACDGKVEASLVLDVAGLMSTDDAAEVAETFSVLLKVATKLGVQISDPFMLMSFLSLPVIPHLKMTDIGLVDVDSFCHTSLWVE